ncbi:MAG: hypothetical protein J0M12_12255 [Deltaproteobacteria bacterium]|nr:hypothetical protein [Deltaproteobacteria bacterium]
MTQSGRMDSTLLPLVAVVDDETFNQRISGRGVLGRRPVKLGLMATAGLIQEALQGDDQLHVLCGADESRRRLIRMRWRLRSRMRLSFPRTLADPRCLVLPDSGAELSEMLRRFERVIVVGGDGAVYHRAEAVLLPPVVIPAGAPAATHA